MTQSVGQGLRYGRGADMKLNNRIVSDVILFFYQSILNRDQPDFVSEAEMVFIPITILFGTRETLFQL